MLLTNPVLYGGLIASNSFLMSTEFRVQMFLSSILFLSQSSFTCSLISVGSIVVPYTGEFIVGVGYFLHCVIS